MGDAGLFFKIKRNLFKMAISLHSQPFLAYYSNKFKPLIIRKNTSDLYVFRQIFVKKEYDFPFKTNPKLIIDAGAYAGYSSLWFASRYPNADIIAIEPDESNFEILEKNTANHERIRRIWAGLWHKDAFLKIRAGNFPKFGIMTEEVSSKDYDVKAITIDGILEESGHGRIDILKLDIEGAEKELFSKNYESWLGKVDVLIIELHDRKKDGCSKAFRQAARNYSWDEFRRGENIILVRNDLAGSRD